jgi:hypothetical protein
MKNADFVSRYVLMAFMTVLYSLQLKLCNDFFFFAKATNILELSSMNLKCSNDPRFGMGSIFAWKNKILHDEELIVKISSVRHLLMSEKSF